MGPAPRRLRDHSPPTVSLEQFVGETPPQELLTVEEFLEARRAVLAELRASEPAAAPPAASTDLLPPGCDEPPPGVPAQPAGLVSRDRAGRSGEEIECWG